MDFDRASPSGQQRPSFLEDGRQSTDPPRLQNSDSHDSHIRVDEPSTKPKFLRNSQRVQSTKSVSEALKLGRSREEQETLLGEEEEADDDGCYPPRVNDEPRAPNPHKSLPVRQIDGQRVEKSRTEFTWQSETPLPVPPGP